jgi:hypothetical protein
VAADRFAARDILFRFATVSQTPPSSVAGARIGGAAWISGRRRLVRPVVVEQQRGAPGS